MCIIGEWSVYFLAVDAQKCLSARIWLSLGCTGPQQHYDVYIHCMVLEIEPFS